MSNKSKIYARVERMNLPPDIQILQDQLDDAERDARKLAAGLTDDLANWRPSSSSWTVAEILDHLAVCNQTYLAAMRAPALRAREQGRLRRRPAEPGWIAGFFVRSIEPPAKARIKAPQSIQPRTTPPLADALEHFCDVQNQVRAYLNDHGDLDLAAMRFANPFIPGIRFSLATGLHIISAHERRHLWQAWRVRKGAEAAHK
jgi:hypothetical protein